MSRIRLACCLALLTWACGGASDPTPVDEADGAAVEAPPVPEGLPPAEPGTPLHDLRTAIAALAERPEHDSKFVRVQHVLIGVKGGQVPGVERSLAEAEARAAEIFRLAQDGEPFRQLQIGTDDPGPGEYAMQDAQRGNYAKAFGDVAWRLFPGEVGVCAYDPETSPFGYHVIRRIL